MDMNKLNLQKFIISIVIVGVVLVIGIYITDSIGDVSKATNTAGSVTNETGAFINITGYTLALSTAEDFASPVLTAIWNTTDDASILLGNATVSSVGVVTNATVTNWENVYVSYTYRYTADTDASDAAADVVDALATGTSWISILVVVGFAVIILTMLTSGLGSTVRESSTPYY